MDTSSNHVDTLNQLDRDCVGELLMFGREHFGDKWNPVQAYEDDLGGDPNDLQLFLPWAVYMYRVGGETAATSYRAKKGEALEADRLAWLDAQDAAHISIYEVLDTKPGVGIAVRCHLTDTEHFVHEPRASLSLAKGHALCARVVTLQQTSVFCGVHNVAISADSAKEMAQEVAVALGLDAPPAPVATLRTADATEEVLLSWEAAVLDAERAEQLAAGQDNE